MANADRPCGLAPVGHLNGDTWNGQVNTYVILANAGYLATSFVTITAGGTGTNGTYALVITDAGGGVGASGTYTVAGSTITAVNITNAGFGYVTPILSFPSGGVTGQNITIVPGSDTNVYGIGSAIKSFPGGDKDGVPAVILAAAGEALRGSIVGVMPLSADSPVAPIPSLKLRDYYVTVSDDDTVVYEIQANNAGNFSRSDLNANANLVVGAPVGISPFATTELNASTTDVTATLQLKILGKSKDIGVDLTANTKLRVMINNHELRGATLAVV